uniref:ATP synthase 8 n=1 Tax=Proasellus cavaticus TaxID=1281949 RepID=A0A485M905_9CRUS|nr:ATP synthase 8 [Proasellus cavaticus]
MAPIFWTLLFTLFFATLATFVVKLYFFTMSDSTPAHNPQNSLQEMTWQW